MESEKRFIVKLSDFGLARTVSDQDYYKSENAIMPSKLIICKLINLL